MSVWEGINHSKACMKRPLENGCTCTRGWRWKRRLCVWPGRLLCAAGYTLALPGLLVVGIGEWLREVPWRSRSSGAGETR